MTTKVTIAKENFATREQMFGMWIARVQLAEQDGMIEALEQSFDHEPTEDDYTVMQQQWIGINKSLLLSQVEKYDKSDAVNGFYVNGKHMWLDKHDRDSLSYSIRLEKEDGIENTTLWADPIQGVKFTIPCDAALQMLSKIELYAKACFNRTAEHKHNISQLNTIEDVATYDHTTGYPEQLQFKV